MDYFYYGTQLVICLPEVFLFCLWLSGFAKIREMKRVWKCCIFLAIILFCHGAGLLLNAPLDIVMSGIFLFLLGLALFQGEPQKILFCTFLYCVAETALEIMTILCISIMIPGNSVAATVSLYNGLLVGFLVRFLQFLLILFTIKYLHPAKIYNGTRDYLLFGLPPAGIFLLLLGVCTLESVLDTVDSNSGEFLWFKLFLILGSIGAVIVNTVVVYMIGETASSAGEIKRLELLLVQDELERKHYKELEDVHLQYDIFLHDVRRMIRAIAAMVEEQNWNNANLLADYMVDSIKGIGSRILCFHDILDSLLTERKSYAETQGLSMTIEGKEPLLLGEINEIDMVALVGNLLDNAINAEKDAPVKEGILCRIFTALDCRHIVIEVENSYDKDKEVEKKRNGKSDRQSERIGHKHGIGLISIQETLGKYGGMISRRESENRYYTKVILPNGNKTGK